MVIISDYIRRDYDNLGDHSVTVYYNIIDENAKMFLIQDGDLLEKFDNNILGRAKKNISNFIMVYIRPIERNLEYTPWEEESYTAHIDRFCGGADKYLDTLDNEIIPRIIKDLGMKIKEDNIYLAGASLGGLLSAYGLYEYPEIGGAIMVSPSFWYPGFLNYMESKDVDLTGKTIYMDIGEEEHKGLITNCNSPKEDFEAGRKILLSKGVSKDKISCDIHPGMHHKEVYFLDRIYKGIEYILRN